ncbi:IucC family-domain-containing protein [Chaetomium sp. MPI-SDFR-AT-0129]|nr:IucC family-domain-containing protein [Chaetomium sp. MPI-SDFR-AT-0129]
MDPGETMDNANGLTLAQQAAMETTSRLVVSLLNDGLVDIALEDGQLSTGRVSSLTLVSPKDWDGVSTRITISLRRETRYKLLLPTTPEESSPILTPPLEPADIVGPVVVIQGTSESGGNGSPQLVYRPEKVFDVVAPWVCPDQEMATKLRGELENSADNQGIIINPKCYFLWPHGFTSLIMRIERWLEFEASRPPPQLGSPLIVWEQSLIKGHPTHPMHRSFCANPPPNPKIDSIEDFLTAKVIIISLPRDRIHLDGPFEESIAPLIQRLNIPTETTPPNRALIPCFAAQLPTIHRYFGSTDADIKVESPTPLHGKHQTSMRTITLPDFPYHLKMALSFTITSATRTMTPWTTRMCIEVSSLLEKIADPELLWIARKRAAACSADPDFERAKHLSVMLREDPEPRASGRGECLVLPATLFEVSSRGGEEEKERVGRAVELFGLGSSVEAKREWFRNYTHLYLLSTLPLLLSHGICLESHLQNLLARFDTTTHTLRGFVYRDMGGLRMHKPTLAARGIRVRSADLVPGAVTLIEDLEPAWANAYHCLENHLGGAMRGLGLQWEEEGEEGKGGGWGVVREELRKVLDGCADPDGKREELWEFLVRPVVKRKAFLRMKVAGVYRGVYLLTRLGVLESVLHASKPIGLVRQWG